jgi:hypothetical protein
MVRLNFAHRKSPSVSRRDADLKMLFIMGQKILRLSPENND